MAAIHYIIVALDEGGFRGYTSSMTGLPLAVLVAAALSAQDMTQPSRGMQACLSNASAASTFYGRLTPAGKTKFNEMYNAYAAMVQKRKSEGWTNGGALGMGNQITNFRRSFQVLGVAKTLDPTAPFRGKSSVAPIPTAQVTLERQVAALEQEFQNASAARRWEILDQLTVIRKERDLPRGVCEDWAKETTATLKPIAGGEFSVEWHEISRGGHAVTFVKNAETGGCIALDPWYRGLPELVSCGEAEEIRAQDTGSCFAVYPPPS